MRAHNLRKFSHMRPNQCVAGSINQTADGARYATRERVEVVSGYSLIMRSSDNQRRHGYLFQPRPAVKCNEPPDCTTHGWRAIGGQERLQPSSLLTGEGDGCLRP